MHPRGRSRGPFRGRAPAVAVIVFTLLLSACGGGGPRTPILEPTPPASGEEHVLTTADGIDLQLHYWDRDPDRVVIYIHEFLADQSTWWPVLTWLPDDAAALTFDLRGHGETLGDLDDREQMLDDTHAVLAFAREHGSSDVVLAGSGMGAAIAMLVAADEPDVFVIALSAPSEFSDLVPADVVADLRDRVVFMAADGDLSAAHSLETLVELADLPDNQWRLFEGRLHGVEMIADEEQDDARRYFAEMLQYAWTR